MPDEIDPRWEYWAPDDDTEEILAGERKTDGTIIGVLGLADGFRFGCGAKEFGWLPQSERVGRDGRDRTPVPRARRVCPCGKEFVPKRAEQRHCGTRCATGPSRNSRWDAVWAGGRAEQIVRAVAMRKAGVSSLAEIAAAVGANLHTVNRWLRREGLTVPGKGRPPRRKKAHKTTGG